MERLLEDADSFAADVARRHVMRPGTRMVTAAINSVDWLAGSKGYWWQMRGANVCHCVCSCPAGVSGPMAGRADAMHVLWAATGVAQMPINQNLRLAGQVVWTGTSSLLVSRSCSSISLTRTLMSSA